MCLLVNFSHISEDMQEEDVADHELETQMVNHYLSSSMMIVFNPDDTVLTYDRIWEEIVEKFHNFEARGSGQRAQHIAGLYLNLFKYRPLQGGRYIPTPVSVKQKHAVINVKNTDERCILYALAAGLRKTRDVNCSNINRANTYSEGELAQIKTGNLKHPIQACDIPKLEQKNPELAICCYGLYVRENADQIAPLYISPRALTPNTLNLNLLLLFDEQLKGHYCYISNIHALLAKTVRTSPSLFCVRCSQSFSARTAEERQAKFQQHLEDCLLAEVGKFTFPEGNIKFKNYKTMTRCGWVAYFDFECQLVPGVSSLVNQPSHLEPPETDGDDHSSSTYARFLASAYPHHPPFSTTTSTTRKRPAAENIAAGRAGGRADGGGPEPEPEQQQPTPAKKPKLPAGTILHTHELMAFTIYLVGPEPKHNMLFTSVETNVEAIEDQLMDALLRIQSYVKAFHKSPANRVPLQWTSDEEQERHKDAVECEICHEPFLLEIMGYNADWWRQLMRNKNKYQSRDPNKPNYLPRALLKGPKVADHCHFSGR